MRRRGRRRFRDRGMGAESGLDLPELDPEPADLHLAIAASRELDVAVREQPSHVSRAIDAARSTLGVGEEGGRGQVRPAPVPKGDVRAADRDLAVELAGVATRAQEEHLRLLDGPPHRDRGPLDPRLPADEVLQRDRRLRGAEAVDDQAAARETVPDGHDVLETEGVGERLFPQAAQDQPVDGRSRMVDGDPPPAQRIDEGADSPAPHVDGAQGGTVEQRAEDVHDRGVHAVRGQEGQPVVGREVQVVGVRADEVQHVAMALEHALGTAGGSGRVEDVGRAIGGHAAAPRLHGRAGEHAVDAQHLAAARESPGEIEVPPAREQEGGT